MWPFGKSNSAKSQHIQMLTHWNSANPTKSDKSQWSVSFRTRSATFVFFINLPPGFPEKAPVFKFQKPVVHPWVDSHDGVTILNEGLLQWTPHCDVTRIGKNCVHEFVTNPPRFKSESNTASSYGGSTMASYGNSPSKDTYTPLGGNRVSSLFAAKPFGLKLRAKNKRAHTGATIYSIDRPRTELKIGMWLVTVGTYDVEALDFSQIIKVLGQASVPVRIIFESPTPLDFSMPNSRSNSNSNANSPQKYGGYGAQPYYQRPQVGINRPQVHPEAKSTIEPPPQPNLTSPEIPPSAFDILDTFSINKMEDINADDLALEQLALSLTNTDLNQRRKDLRDKTRAAAAKQLASKNSVISLRKEAESLRTEVGELQKANETLYAAKERLAPKIDKVKIKKALREAAAKSDATAKELMEKFEEDEIAYITFIKKYKTARAFHHEHLMLETLLT